MKFKMPRNLMAAVSVVAFAALLSSCGGGGSGSGDPVAAAPQDDETPTPPAAGPMIAGETVPSGTVVMLPEGTDAPNVTFRAAMGDTVPVAGIGVFTCVSADGCSVDVTDDVVTTSGDIEVVSLEITDAAVLAQLANAISPPEVPEPTELETAQAAAVTAAADAKTASDNAAAASTAAAEAVANLATIQTGTTSAALAKEAADYAAKAMTAYMDAKAASETAVAAEDVTAAVEARLLADLAMADAVSYSITAVEKGTAAETAANAELIIVGTVKTVGDTSIDADAPRSVVTAGEAPTAQVTDTGLQAKGAQPTTEGPATPGRTAVAGDETDDPDPYKSPVVNADARTFGIGKLVDSADDTARLMIITQYAGTMTVKVFASDTTTDGLTGPLGSDGRIRQVGEDGTVNTADDTFVTLKSEGMYYRASNAATLQPMSPDASNNALLGDTVAGGLNAKAWAKPVEVFSFPSAADATVKAYVVLKDTSTNETTGVTTVSYAMANIHVAVDVDGVLVNNAPVPEDVEVTAKIPNASDYKHIHFGVWADLGAAKPSGAQVPADLGIGFVQSIGDGLTGADMPNNGSGTYTGDWAATLQAADEDGDGKITLTNGRADLTADFGKGTITADLANLATLTGDISGNTFSGEKASAIIAASGLDAEADFEGSFSGGFYGSKAAEAGGIFNFASDDGNNEGGAFRGAFGADRKLP